MTKRRRRAKKDRKPSSANGNEGVNLTESKDENKDNQLHIFKNDFKRRGTNRGNSKDDPPGEDFSDDIEDIKDSGFGVESTDMGGDERTMFLQSTQSS